MIRFIYSTRFSKSDILCLAFRIIKIWKNVNSLSIFTTFLQTNSQYFLISAETPKVGIGKFSSRLAMDCLISLNLTNSLINRLKWVFSNLAFSQYFFWTACRIDPYKGWCFKCLLGLKIKQVKIFRAQENSNLSVQMKVLHSFRKQQT